MRQLVHAFVFIGCLAAPAFAHAGGPQNHLTAQERASGWKLLFDGRTTRGWHNFRSAGIRPQWKVVDGALTLAGKDGGDIVTDGQYASFELSLEWKVSPHGNSGIFYHVVEEGPAAFMVAPEYQVLDNRGSPTQPIHQAAALYDLYPPSQDASLPAGQFNQARLVVDHGRVEHWLNGIKVLEYRLDSPDFATRVAKSKFSATGPFGALTKNFGKAGRGAIALQDHGTTVSFRNIKIRPLD